MKAEEEKSKLIVKVDKHINVIDKKVKNLSL